MKTATASSGAIYRPVKSSVYLIFAMLLALLGCNQPSSYKINLSGDWYLQLDPADMGISEYWHTQDPTTWDTVAVPGFIDDDYDGIVWFAKNFAAPAGKDKMALVFNAIDDNATVYLNGNLIGKHVGWGQRFWFDVSSQVRRGTSNLLTLRLEDTGGPGGIIDSVWLQAYDREEAMHYSSFGKQTAHEAPQWAQAGVLYEVFVRDFSPTGDFDGLTARLDELKDLGVTILWLMPIHPIGEIKRKGILGSPYSVKDYYAINQDFGTAADFTRLVQAVHARNMRIILDMVPNHTAWDNALIVDHEDWYTHNDGQLVSPVDDWSDVADLDYSNSELREYIRTMLTWWITEYDVDGFRIDVAEMMPGDFWLETRPVLKHAKADVFLLAEGSRPYLHVSGFEATYAFNTFRDFRDIANGKESPEAIHQALRNEHYRYPQGSLRMRFLENHDQLRAGDVVKQEERLLAASVGIFLLPGLPMLYNGAELGISHRLELFDQDFIDWESGSTYYRSQLAKLFKLRQQYPALIRGDYQPLERADDVLIYSRNLEDESVIVAINYGQEAIEFILSEDNFAPAEIIYHTAGAAFEQQSKRVILPPFGSVVLR